MLEIVRQEVYLEKEEICVGFKMKERKPLYIHAKLGQSLMEFARMEESDFNEVIKLLAESYQFERLLREESKECMREHLLAAMASALNSNIYLYNFIVNIIEVLCEEGIPAELPVQMVAKKDDWIALDLLRRQSEDKVKEMYAHLVKQDIVKVQQKVKAELDMLWTEEGIELAGLSAEDRLCLLQESKESIYLKQYQTIRDAKGNKYEINDAIHKALFMKQRIGSHPTYELQNIDEMVGFELAALVHNHEKIKACAYCGNWYMVENGACCKPAEASKTEVIILDPAAAEKPRFIAKRTPSGKPRKGGRKVEGQLSLLDSDEENMPAY